MSAHTVDFQTIEYEGHPAFVLVPFDIFCKIRPLLENEAVRNAIPHEIVRRNALEGVSMVKAWREYLGITQSELAKKAGMSQPAIAKLEQSSAKPRKATLKKMADAMSLTLGQLE